MSVVLPAKKIFELTNFEAEWLRLQHPSNYMVLRRMIHDGEAKIIDEVPGCTTGE